VDHYGNAVTGLRAAGVPRSATLVARDARLVHANVFADVPTGSGFWYENSSGLVELAANGASAALLLGVKVGDAVTVEGSLQNGVSRPGAGFKIDAMSHAASFHPTFGAWFRKTFDAPTTS